MWPNGCMDQDVTWYGGRPQPRRLCVRWGPSSSLPKKGRSPQFSTHVYCGQKSAWIKMIHADFLPLGMEVALGPDDIVLDGDPAPNFRSMWPNGWTDQHGTWHEGAPWSRLHRTRCGPSSPPQKGDRAPNFRLTFIVAKRLDASRCHLVWR